MHGREEHAVFQTNARYFSVETKTHTRFFSRQNARTLFLLSQSLQLQGLRLNLFSQKCYIVHSTSQ